MNVDVSESEEPVVSIVMAAYNEADHIRAAIDSVINQTFTDWELIIVDDGSTDKTQLICDAYAKRDPRIRTLANQQNHGLPRSLNLGIEHARGNLIARADADDINLPSRLAVQFVFMQGHPDIDVLGTGAYVLDKSGRRVAMINLPSTHEQLSQLSFRKTMFFHPSVMIRRRFFDQVGLYDPSYLRAQDKELWLRGLGAGCRYANIGEPLIQYQTDGYVRSWRSLFYRTSSLLRIAQVYRIKHGVLSAITSLLVSSLIKVGLYTPASLRRGNA